MYTKAEVKREQGMTVESLRVECDGHGMERWVWNGKMRTGKTSWSLS